MISKIGLGTAQFGIKYGILNPKEKVPEEEALSILKEALNCGINTVDTAVAYGVSEEVIGKFTKINKASFNIISKLPLCEVDKIEENIIGSLKRLNVNRLYGYIFHDFNLYRKRPDAWGILEGMKKKGDISKIGFSLYHTQDLERLIKDDIKIDLLQLPYSIFDRRFEKYFKILRNKNIELHVRSVFLQGLFFIEPIELHRFFSSVFDKLEILRRISSEKKLPVLKICLKFVLSNQYIDKAILGVHTLKQLNQIVHSVKNNNKIEDFSNEFSLLKVDNEKILLPFNWNIN